MITPSARLAIVDDDASVRKALARLLGLYNYSPQTFGSAREFLDSLRIGIPECLILDLQMPDMTGLELQSELARLGVNIPTIIVTAHNDFRDKCRAAGATAYLVKPLDKTSLLDAVDSAIQRRSTLAPECSPGPSARGI